MIQERKIPEEKTLAYLAGIIDGEGTIAILKHKHKDKISSTYRLRVSVGSTDKILLEWLKENFGGKIYLLRPRKGQWKEAYQWIMANKEAHKILKLIKPYLVIKDKQADLGIEFHKIAKNHNFGHRVPVWLNTKRETDYQKMKELHS